MEMQQEAGKQFAAHQQQADKETQAHQQQADGQTDAHLERANVSFHCSCQQEVDDAFNEMLSHLPPNEEQPWTLVSKVPSAEPMTSGFSCPVVESAATPGAFGPPDEADDDLK